MLLSRRLFWFALGSVVVEAFLVAGCAGGSDGRQFERLLKATTICRGTAAKLHFEPHALVEVRLEGRSVAWANTAGRGLDVEACARTRTQQGWFTGLAYIRTRRATTLDCRFRGRFFVHVEPVFTSTSGGLLPDGSAVVLDVGSRHTLVASATVARPAEQSSLAYSRRSCKPESP